VSAADDVLKTSKHHEAREVVALALYASFKQQADEGGIWPLMVGPAVGSDEFSGVALIDGEVDIDAAADAALAALAPIVAAEAVKAIRCAARKTGTPVIGVKRASDIATDIASRICGDR
jgi:hypothetical protein